MAHRKRTLLPIGIHLGTEAIHMAQLDQAEGDVQVVSKASMYFPAGKPGQGRTIETAETVDAPSEETDKANYELGLSFIRKKVGSNGFRGREAVISLPPQHLTIQHVRLGQMQPEELATALPGELRGKLPFDAQQAVIRHIVAGTVSENNEAKQDLIVLAARRAVVERHVEAMNHMGLHVIGVGAEPCAMCYAYAFAATHGQATQEGPASLMVVYLGSRVVHVAITRGGETTFVKEVEQGTRLLTKALAQARDIPVEEAAALRAQWCQAPGQESLQAAVDAYNSIKPALEHLIDEIESCMRYHASLSRGVRVDRVCFVGPDARDRGLMHVLSAQLAAACELGDPFGVVTGRADREHAEPDMAVAVGLSLFTAP
jgi:type IV pilus assembly protein PilM